MSGIDRLREAIANNKPELDRLQSLAAGAHANLEQAHALEATYTLNAIEGNTRPGCAVAPGGSSSTGAAKTAREAGATALVIGADPRAAGFYRRMGAVEAGVVPSGSIPGRMLPLLKLRL